MMKEMLADLLSQKAEEKRAFSKDEAMMDLKLNSSDKKQHELAKRWGWNQSTVSRFLSPKNEKSEAENTQMHNRASNLHNSASNIDVFDSKNEDSESTLHNRASNLHKTDTEQEKGFLPHTPSFQKEDPPSKERKPPLKGGQKKENFPPSKPIPGPKNLQELGLLPNSGFPFTTTEAEDYFRRRLEADPSAVEAGHTARDLADSFFWYWDGFGFQDPKTGKPITPRSWRARANTWWQLKDKYGGPKPQKKVFGGTVKYGFQ